MRAPNTDTVVIGTSCRPAPTTPGPSHRCHGRVLSLHRCCRSVCCGTASLSGLCTSLQRGQLATCIFQLVLQRQGCRCAIRLHRSRQCLQCTDSGRIPEHSIFRWLGRSGTASIFVHLQISYLLVRFSSQRGDPILELTHCQLGPASVMPLKLSPSQIRRGLHKRGRHAEQRAG